MTGEVTADGLEKENYTFERELEAGLPMPVWSVDLEVERQRIVTAAEVAVLRFIETGTRDLAGLTRKLGLGQDTRLAAQVLVKLLGAGAIDREGDGFVLLPTGETWKSAGTARTRVRVTHDVRLDPVLGTIAWMDTERSLFPSDDTWTIELPPVRDEELEGRAMELGELLRTDGLPDAEDLAPHEEPPPMDLRAFCVVSRRMHFRPVQIGVWRHPSREEYRLVGHIDGAENPPLTAALARHQLADARRRIVLASRT